MISGNKEHILPTNSSDSKCFEPLRESSPRKSDLTVA